MSSTTFNNMETGELRTVYNVTTDKASGDLIYKISGRPNTIPTGAWFAQYNFLYNTGLFTADGWLMLGLNPEYTIVRGTRQQQEDKPEPETESAQPQTTQQADDIKQLAAIFGRMGCGQMSEERVIELAKKIFREEIEAYKGPTITIEIKKEDKKIEIEGIFNSNMPAIIKSIDEGENIYMYGPAGTGKSYTAQQVAKALGLDFYESSQVLFAHDIRGFVDANGNYIETPFYKAFRFGGLMHLDELDSCAPEAIVQFNNAIANRIYDFPGIGRVEAHKDFRVIASGNTRMAGASLEYTSRCVMDQSTVNRFGFVEIKYERDLENAFSKGDSELVDFAHDFRRAVKAANTTLLFTYRNIKQCANKKLVEAWGGKAGILKFSVFQGREAEELRPIYTCLKNKSNSWAKAFEEYLNSDFFED